MFYTGFTDEAAPDLINQAKALKMLGWKHMESRGLNGSNLAHMSDEDFERVKKELAETDISINCYGSGVANWQKNPFKEEDFKASIDELERALPRMQEIGCKSIRGMSFVMQRDRDPGDREWEDEVVKKLSILVDKCEKAGVMYLHENCMNFGGISSEHSLRLIERINSKAFSLVFDTGNPVMDRNKYYEKLGEGETAWEFYKAVKEHVTYVHIKDGIFNKAGDDVFPDCKFTYPGEGDGQVREIVTDLLASGYDGGFSMEPHMGAVFHDDKITSDEDSQLMTFVEYGKRFMKMVEEIKLDIAAKETICQVN